MLSPGAEGSFTEGCRVFTGRVGFSGEMDDGSVVLSEGGCWLKERCPRFDAAFDLWCERSCWAADLCNTRLRDVWTSGGLTRGMTHDGRRESSMVR